MWGVQAIGSLPAQTQHPEVEYRRSSSHKATGVCFLLASCGGGEPPHPTPFHLVQARLQDCILRTEKVTVSPGPSMCSKPKAVVSCTESVVSPMQIKMPPWGYYLKHWFKDQVSQRNSCWCPCLLGESGTHHHPAVGYTLKSQLSHMYCGSPPPSASSFHVMVLIVSSPNSYDVLTHRTSKCGHFGNRMLEDVIG